MQFLHLTLTSCEPIPTVGGAPALAFMKTSTSFGLQFRKRVRILSASALRSSKFQGLVFGLSCASATLSSTCHGVLNKLFVSGSYLLIGYCCIKHQTFS